jgi:hypothetical protein
MRASTFHRYHTASTVYIDIIDSKFSGATHFEYKCAPWNTSEPPNEMKEAEKNKCRPTPTHQKPQSVARSELSRGTRHRRRISNAYSMQGSLPQVQKQAISKKGQKRGRDRALKPTDGIEPSAFRLRNGCSTAKLCRQNNGNTNEIGNPSINTKNGEAATLSTRP